MKVDAKRRALWVCTTAHPQMSNFAEAEDGSSAVLKLDLASGKLLKRYSLPNGPAKHWLGDLVVNSRGEVFVTDSLTPAVYTITRAKDELEPLIEGAPFASPQGLDFSADEKKLFVADYSKGLFVVDLSARQVSAVAPAPDTTLLGIDGLYFYRGGLIAVQNSAAPHRVARFFLSRDLRRVEGYEVVEANNPLFDEPTLGALVGDTFYYVANRQWGAVDKKGRLAPAEKLRDPVILKVRL